MNTYNIALLSVWLKNAVFFISRYELHFNVSNGTRNTYCPLQDNENSSSTWLKLYTNSLNIQNHLALNKEGGHLNLKSILFACSTVDVLL